MAFSVFVEMINSGPQETGCPIRLRKSSHEANRRDFELTTSLFLLKIVPGRRG